MKRANQTLLLVIILLVGLQSFCQTPKLLKPINSGDLIEKGIKYFDEKKYEEAEKIFKMISRNDTNYAIALYELGLTYDAQGKYEQTIELANKILQNNHLIHNKVQVYVMLGNALDDAKRGDEAIVVYQNALKEFPYSHSIYFNMGITYFNRNELQKAQEAFTNAIKINVYHQRSHSMLGLSLIKMGQIVPGIMSLTMGGLLNPTSNSGLNSLRFLEKYYNGELDDEINKEKSTMPDEYANPSYNELEMLIKSDFASNKKFKVDSDIESKIIKQSYLIFSKIQTVKNPKGLWNEFYIPFFKELMDKNYFETYSYYLLSGIDNESITYWNKKNKSKVDKFISWASTYINSKRLYGLSYENEKHGKLVHYYDDRGNLSSIGRFSDPNFTQPVGNWIFINSMGGCVKKGEFVNGKKEGKWFVYHKNGEKDEELNYEDDKLEGHGLKFYENGELYIDVNFEKDKFSGIYKEYNESGAIVEKSTYEAGKYNGAKYEYFPHGQLFTELEYKTGKRDGVFKRYFVKGGLELQASYKNDLAEGEYIEYYSNGQLYSKGSYKNGEPVGNWKTYHYNGKLNQEGSYNDKGKKTGIWKNYYSNGSTESIIEYSSNGKQNGEAKYFDEEANLICTYVFKNEILTEVVYWDSQQKERARFIQKRGTLELTTYDINGNIQSSGKLVEGKREGLWKYYNSNGILTSEENYNNGLLQGMYKSYFPDGTVYTYTEYTEGEKNGLYQEYFRNGVLSVEGYYKNDKREGSWFSYYKNGNVSSITNYLNGKWDGYFEEYDYLGRKSKETFYKNDLLMQNILFDSTGRAYSIDSLKNGNGIVRRVNWDGSLGLIAEFKSGLWKDTVKVFNIRGVKTFEGFYINGKKDGIAKTYNDLGVLINESQYDYGEHQSVNKIYDVDGKLEKQEFYINNRIEKIIYYYPNGKIETEIEYSNGERTGFTKYYLQDGMFAFQLYYRNSYVVAYNYRGKDGKLVDLIPLVNGTGKIITYFQNGNKSAEIEYLNGERTGRLIYYFPSGIKRFESNYVKGQDSGVAREWNVDGVLISEKNYIDDDLNGTVKFYYNNGVIKSIENYLNDELHGECKYYDKTGKVKNILFYYNGQLIG